MRSVVASALLIAARLDLVLPVRSLNFGWSATVPVTVAPAYPAAFSMPLVIPDDAPGSVTRTILFPVSMALSSFGSAVWRNASLALVCCTKPSRCALTADSWLRSELLTVRRPSMVLPCSSVEPSTIPIASARNTATIETR